MINGKLDFLKERFSQYEICFSEDGKEAAIINPASSGNIEVYYYEDHGSTPYCVCFSFQHCHFADEEETSRWINEIINGNMVIIEFFRKGSSVFGGDIERKELVDLSYEKLMDMTGYVGLAELLDIADSFKVRGWNKEDCFDGSFYRERKGKISIRYQDTSMI